MQSLGCTLYALAYSHSPFENTQTTEQGGSIAMAVMGAQYKHPPSAYSQGLRDLIDSMLKVKPQERPDIHEVRFRLGIIRVAHLTNNILPGDPENRSGSGQSSVMQRHTSSSMGGLVFFLAYARAALAPVRSLLSDYLWVASSWTLSCYIDIYTYIIASRDYDSEGSLRRLFLAFALAFSPANAPDFVSAGPTTEGFEAGRALTTDLVAAASVFMGDLVGLGFDFFAGFGPASSLSSAAVSGLRSSFRFFEGGALSALLLSLVSAYASSSESAEEFTAAASSLASFFALCFAFMTFCFSRFALIAASFAFCERKRTRL